MKGKVLAVLLRERERLLFTDRSEILAVLHRNAELTQQGKGVNLALVGRQRIGKTMLARRFADDLSERHSPLVPIYFDVARNLYEEAGQGLADDAFNAIPGPLDVVTAMAPP